MKNFRNIILFVLVAIPLFTTCTGNKDSVLLDIKFEKYQLANGLQVILHPDNSDPIISYAIMYHTGSSRETRGKTGFAHLFEHLLFSGSENVAPGMFDMILEEAGGTNNGGTSRDMTVYYEIFPKNALEKVLWLESDRMGFFINSVTKKNLAIQQNVVQNEKRQYEDNAPYGFTETVISNYLYPPEHPYNWQVIGEMEDLRNASLDDARNFYNEFYGPNNATLTLAGDFIIDSVKPILEKYFGEIASHGDVNKRSPMPATLSESVRLQHEDNFANVPELTMVWPAPEQFSKDAYAMDFLAKLLADGKKAPFYKILVKEKELTSAVSAYYSSQELAGEFIISVRAAEGKTLTEIESAIAEAFNLFEKEGFSERDIERIKASSEKDFYSGINSVLGKSLQLAYYNTFLGNPGYIQDDINNIKAVTKEEVMRVYNNYIKDKPFLLTSFVPAGQPETGIKEFIQANVREEKITEASQVAIEAAVESEFDRSVSSFDRTIIPGSGSEPEVKLPEVWTDELDNGIKVYGIENRELPLISLSIVIDGGISLDRVEMPGVASMTAGLLAQGTKNKTPEELEEEMELLGTNISVSASREEIVLSAGLLSRNYKKSVDLITEILMEPRWDSSEFKILLNRTKNSIIQSAAEPRSIAQSTFYSLLYGKDHIFGYPSKGTSESVEKITINDLKSFYNNYFTTGRIRIHITGDISKEEALAALANLTLNQEPVVTPGPVWPDPEIPEKSVISFVDVPGSRQSVIYIGYPSVSRSDPDYIKADFINYRLGGAFTSIFNQILREEKGFTYGASSSFVEMKSKGPFIASTMVRSDATLESLMIFRDEMNKYRLGIPQKEVDFIKNCIIRSNALRFETNEALNTMISTMSKYGLSKDYIKDEEAIIKGMTPEEHKVITEKYIDPSRMVWLVVGDAASQMQSLEKLGLGKPQLIKR